MTSKPFLRRMMERVSAMTFSSSTTRMTACFFWVGRVSSLGTSVTGTTSYLSLMDMAVYLDLNNPRPVPSIRVNSFAYELTLLYLSVEDGVESHVFFFLTA